MPRLGRREVVGGVGGKGGGGGYFNLSGGSIPRSNSEWNSGPRSNLSSIEA